jgi:AmmeMemoRadiSam system protein A
MHLSLKEQAYLLGISRKALEHFFETGEELAIAAEEVPEDLRVEKASFVTLTKKGQLRGCIGKLLPVQMLYLDVLENTYSAAFSDYRFEALEEVELQDIKIEISVLSIPEVLKYDDPAGLIVYLEQKRPGVIIKQGYHSATFLPQVWNELTDAKSFLEQLCLKAGLEKDAWQIPQLEVKTYTVQSFSEDQEDS